MRLTRPSAAAPFRRGDPACSQGHRRVNSVLTTCGQLIAEHEARPFLRLRAAKFQMACFPRDYEEFKVSRFPRGAHGSFTVHGAASQSRIFHMQCPESMVCLDVWRWALLQFACGICPVANKAEHLLWRASIYFYRDYASYGWRSRLYLY